MTGDAPELITHVPRPSPNIWQNPDSYEIENRSFDQAGRIEAAMVHLHGRPIDTMLDIGCGAGFHLPRFATAARHVIGLEPHPPLARAATERGRHRGLHTVSVLRALAEQLPLADRCVDVAHARWAYFFGPGCEPGLAELGRVMRPGGTGFIIDNDATTSTVGSWFRRQWPAYDPVAVERFWRRRGWQRHPLTVSWQMTSRADFEEVVGIEFDPHLASRILAEHPGTGVDYAINLWWRRF